MKKRLTHLSINKLFLIVVVGVCFEQTLCHNTSLDNGIKKYDNRIGRLLKNWIWKKRKLPSAQRWPRSIFVAPSHPFRPDSMPGYSACLVRSWAAGNAELGEAIWKMLD